MICPNPYFRYDYYDAGLPFESILNLWGPEGCGGAWLLPSVFVVTFVVVVVVVVVESFPFDSNPQRSSTTGTVFELEALPVTPGGVSCERGIAALPLYKRTAHHGIVRTRYLTQLPVNTTPRTNKSQTSTLHSRKDRSSRLAFTRAHPSWSVHGGLECAYGGDVHQQYHVHLW